MWDFFWKLLYKNEMEQQTIQIFELFKSLLANLNLPENKTIILSCVVKKLKYCVTTHAQFDIYDSDDLEIV